MIQNDYLISAVSCYMVYYDPQPATFTKGAWKENLLCSIAYTYSAVIQLL